MKKPKKSVREQLEAHIDEYARLGALALAALDMSHSDEAAKDALKYHSGISRIDLERIVQGAWTPSSCESWKVQHLPKDRLPASKITPEDADAHRIPEICEAIHGLPGVIGSPAFIRAWNSGEIKTLFSLCSGAREAFKREKADAEEDAAISTRETGLPFTVTEYGWIVPPRNFNPFAEQTELGRIDGMRETITRYVLWGYDPEEPLPDWFPSTADEGAHGGWDSPDQRLPVNRYAHMGRPEGFLVNEEDGLYLLAQTAKVAIEVGKQYPARILRQGDKYQIPGDDKVLTVKDFGRPRGLDDDAAIIYMGATKAKPQRLDPDDEDESDENPLAADDDADEEAQPAAPPSLFDALAS